jgi:DNA-directed RNA polymerase subunit RPC12/RpoP
MATIDFTCQKCEGNFELDSQDLVDGTEKLECPHCENKLTKSANEDFTAALGELIAQLTAISKKFTASIELDSEDLGAADLDEDEDDDEDDDDDDLDDDDEDDDDDDDDDLDEDEDEDDDR